MCSGCGKDRKSASPQIVIAKAVTGYQEGQDGYEEVIYTGNQTLKVAGKYTGNFYYFAPDTIRIVDKNDAVEFVNTGLFGIVEKEVESGEYSFESDSPED